jgi:hypothetical protein
MKKRSGEVAKVGEHLPSKCKALSSKPSTTKKIIKAKDIYSSIIKTREDGERKEKIGTREKYMG